MRIRLATPADVGEIFTLQRAAFVDEARLYETPHVPPLWETFEECGVRLDASTSWVAADGHRIIGAVSQRLVHEVPHVERLMVAPDRRGERLATALLDAVESHARASGIGALQLIVGDLAVDNQAIYEHLGWTRVSTFPLEDYPTVILHAMEKVLEPPALSDRGPT